MPASSSGSSETDELRPTGEYATACLGRERIFEYFSRQHGVPLALLRLNYATELRYGVLVDLAQQVMAGTEIDLSMGFVNVIWQADASAMALCALEHTSCPPCVLNIAGPEKLRVRDLCESLARQMNTTARFCGREAPDALLSDGAPGYRLLGRPEVDVERMIRWTADWVMRGGPTLGKPTKFQQRDGKF